MEWEWVVYIFVSLVFLVSLGVNGLFGTLIVSAVGYGLFYWWFGPQAGELGAFLLIFASLIGGDSTSFRVSKTNWTPELQKKNGFKEWFDIDINKK